MGAERKDGTRFQPGLGIPLLMVIILTIGGPVLLGGIAENILPIPTHTIVQNYTLMSDGTSQKSTKDAEPTKPISIDWHHGLPEVKIPLVLNSHLKVEFQLIHSLVDFADENRLQTTHVGGISSHVKVGVKGEFSHYKTHLFIGTTAPRKDGAWLIAVCQWEQNRKVNVDMDFCEWQFEEKLPEEIVFSEEGVSEYVIATKSKGSNDAAEQLVLRAVVTEAYD